MPNLTTGQLAALSPRAYGAQIKLRLRDDEAWVDLLDPALVQRTRQGLGHIIVSIDSQKMRIADAAEKGWLVKINALRRHSKARLDALPDHDGEPAISRTKEAQAWRAFAGRLALALRAAAPETLDVINTPYGGMTAREWLEAREEKREAKQ